VGDRHYRASVKDQAAQAGEPEEVSQVSFTVKELDRVVKFVHGLNQLAAEHGVVLDSYSDQFVAVDGKDTPFHLRWADEESQYVSMVVPL
jgi:hypothetical protein